METSSGKIRQQNYREKLCSMHENPAGGCYNVTLFFKAGLRLRIRWDPNTITGSVCAYN